MLDALKQVRAAISYLNPDEVRERAGLPLSIGMVANTSSGHADMEDYLLPDGISREKRSDLLRCLHRTSEAEADRFDIVLYEQGLACPASAFTFYRDDPMTTVKDIMNERPDLTLALARRFRPFRRPVVDRIIQSVARENAFFAIVTALPNVVPSLLELPWSLGEFASDTAFITVNQVRMAFLIAGASDRDVGYMEQKGVIASIGAGAFGWRAIARELAGKIPMGGGLIPKGAIAFAGTYVVGRGLERYHHVGRAYSRIERRDAYATALERGKAVAEAILAGLSKRTEA
ncbi:MAG: hypothetical protein M1541_08955, partial [Acidobacteria bacterium]|nr:hypothetical protein [Acidobacteriota bacterium]